MDTQQRLDAERSAAPSEAADSGTRVEHATSLDGYLSADFPWYGLDDGFRGHRWLTSVTQAPAGEVDYGALGHGDEPSRNLEQQGDRRFVVVVTVAPRPQRRSDDGTGLLEATSASSAAWLAGKALLASTWPLRTDRTLRQEWLHQQTAMAWDLADDLEASAWSGLNLPVDGVATSFRYRESDYGWVLAGSLDGVHLGAYGRGMSAYGLNLGVVDDLTRYARIRDAREPAPASEPASEPAPQPGQDT